VSAAPGAVLRGKVTDQVGAPLPGALLILRGSQPARPEVATRSGEDGTYLFTELQSGPGYRLAASLPGRATLEIADLVLKPGETLIQDIVLLPESQAREYLRVQGKSDVVDTETATASTTFSAEFIAELPLLGRDYQEILTLAPGVSDVNKTGNPNIHGARDVDVVTLVDGVSTTDPFTGLYGQNLNVESIQEIEVITSAADAAFGRAQGGFANILTKSGGNEFQGSFKIFVRSNRVDGDGAGVDPPELTGGLVGATDVTQLSFTDLKPFLSVSGAFVRDRLWYYASGEFIQEETPVNALTEVYVFRTRGYRGFLKSTWQVNAANQLALSFIGDREKMENQGISSLEDVSSGFTTLRGGPTITLRESAVFSPMLMLESTLSWFDNSFSLMPTLDPDTNGNGILFVDDHPELGGDGDGVWEPHERDPGEDWDVDGFYDIFEDFNRNGLADPGEDLDHDGRLNTRLGCEGADREDFNCNGRLDAEVDQNRNGRLDTDEDIGIPCTIEGICPGGVVPSTRGNGRFDGEDRNGNGQLDTLEASGVTPYPYWEDANGNGTVDQGEYRAPMSPDRDLIMDGDGRTFGPFPYDYVDHRKRATWREDLSWFLPDFGGTHDLKVGAVWEHEGYDSDTNRRPRLMFPDSDITARFSVGEDPSVHTPPRVSAEVAFPARVNNQATGDSLGFYLQDTWKPVPNLTMGIGLRFDSEEVASFGYEPFDPAAERAYFNRLMEASGIDSDAQDDLVIRGLCTDPLYTCGSAEDPHLAQITSRLKSLAYGGMTRHNLDIDVLSIFQNVFSGQPANLGARVRKPEDFRISNNNLAPRLSLSWDPWGDGKTKGFASWGRYYGKLFLNSVVLEQGPDTSYRSYSFDADGVDFDGLPNNRLGTQLSQSPLSATQVDRSLSTPYTDELTLGIQRELAPELALGIRYIDRDFQDQLQDIDANHVVRVDPATGNLLDLIGDDSCGIRGCANVADDLPDLHIQNPFFNRIYHLGNYNRQSYKAVELELVRRLHRKWQMEASYTYSVARGDAESYLSSLGDDATLREFEPGYLDYDQRHVIKLNGMAYLPGNWRLGGTATWGSGLPYSAVAAGVSADDVGYHQLRLSYLSVSPQGYGFRQEYRNSHRNPAAYLFNTRVQKDFVVGKSSASAFLEIYNLLNSDNLRVSELQLLRGHFSQALGPGEADYQAPHKELLIGERDFGRRFQFGFQLKF
jgi:hypothetical protein